MLPRNIIRPLSAVCFIAYIDSLTSVALCPQIWPCSGNKDSINDKEAISGIGDAQVLSPAHLASAISSEGQHVSGKQELVSSAPMNALPLAESKDGRMASDGVKLMSFPRNVGDGWHSFHESYSRQATSHHYSSPLEWETTPMSASSTRSDTVVVKTLWQVGRSAESLSISQMRPPHST
eukprot:scaffold87721_cov48-Prasinocladus_malaysianus.AAC.1